MKFSAVLALISAVAVSALPTDASEPHLVARADDVSNLPGKACQCGGSAAGAVSYAAGDIKKAADKTLEHVLGGTIVGANRYPHGYGYNDAAVNFPTALCPKGSKDLYEFPITRGIYTGGEPGPDRVVIRKLAGKKAVYCGLMTHTGVAGNSFQSCSC